MTKLEKISMTNELKENLINFEQFVKEHNYHLKMQVQDIILNSQTKSI